MKDPAESGDPTYKVTPQQEVMSVCLAVVRGVISPDQARAAILARTTQAPLGESLRLHPAILRDVGELSRLPAEDREHCLELFKELWDATPPEQLIEEDRSLGRMLVQQHVVAPHQVDEVRAIQERLWKAGCVPLPRLGELLVRKGYLVAGVADSDLTVRAKGSEPSSSRTASPPPGARLPEAVERASADPAQRYGRYIRVSLLGTGGAGEVWKSWDTVLERWVALKFLRFEDADELARLRREAQLAARLSHPNIAAVFEIADANDRAFLVMEYIEGQTLETFPRGDHRQLVALMRQICQAMQYAHGQGIVHRDIKPGNIMVDSSGRGFIMDFGLARQINAERSLTAHVLGTPSYMPPEQALGGQVDARSDVYSLGATLYELLSGRPPFRGKTVLETLDLVVREEPPPLDRISEDLRTIVAKCLMKEPARRYASAEEVGLELGRWEQGEAIVAHPPSVFYRLGKKIAKRRAVLIAGFAGLGVAVAVAGWVVPRWLRADRGEIEMGRELAAERASREREARALETARIHLDQARKIRVRLDRLLMTEDGSPDSARGLIDQVGREADLALEAYPNYPEALLEKSWILITDRKVANALAYCARAIAARPGFTPAHLTRARVLLDEYDRAGQASDPDPLRVASLRATILQDLKQVQGSSKDTLEISFADGAMAFVEGDFEKAGRILEEYSQSSVSDYRAWQWTGNAWLKVPAMGEKAVRAFTEALKFRPRQASVWASRGAAWLQSARYLRGERDESKAKAAIVQALADLRRAATLEPDEGATLLVLGQAYLQAGNLEEALKSYQRAIDAGKDQPAPYVARAWAKLRGQDADGALADAATALRLGSLDPAAKVVRGRARCVEGDVGGARSDFEEVLAKDPSQIRALVGLGDVERERGNPSGAITYYGRALKIDPGLGEAYLHRGAAERDLGQGPEALDDETRGIELEPTDPVYYFERGVTRCNQEAWSPAEEDFRQALSLRPARPERFWLRLWLVRARRGDPAGARGELAALIKGRAETPAGGLQWRISDFLVGTLSEKEFLATLERTEFSRKSIAEGYFFAGEQALVEGRIPAAQELLRRCLKTGAFVAPGYSTGGAELLRLGGK